MAQWIVSVGQDGAYFSLVDDADVADFGDGEIKGGYAIAMVKEEQVPPCRYCDFTGTNLDYYCDRIFKNGTDFYHTDIGVFRI